MEQDQFDFPSSLPSTAHELQEMIWDCVGDCGMDKQTLMKGIVSILKDSGDIENQLVDFLGYSQIALASFLLTHKARILNLVEPLDNVNLAKKYRRVESSQPFIYARETSPNSSFLLDSYTLPPNTQHVNQGLYEEFVLPFDETDHCNNYGIETVPISMFPAKFQPVFSKYQALNKMQSAVFPCAFYTNNNMLICAPTGAGKTDVAVIVILKALQDYNRCKVVYIAPMKALVTEIVDKLSHRLKHLGIVVREYTGDSQMDRKELINTQIIVSTPEKWDVLTRKSGTGAVLDHVRCIIIDEVHLLHDERGAVLETIVARTMRTVEMTQQICRVVGLSATLPNYQDVAYFLRVNPLKGLYYFGAGFRPVPLTMKFVGVKRGMNSMNRVCYEKVVSYLEDGHQVMVFVHSRNDTTKTAKFIQDLLEQDGFLLEVETLPRPSCRNRELWNLLQKGIGIHHAGLVRQDRHLVENLFEQKKIQVLCCTSTLAWGINLPAHAVIIKGTDVYDTSQNKVVDLGILDVLQIFGRAGRPQYETHGEATLITSHGRLSHYMSRLTQPVPIESRLYHNLIDHLNAEINLGTISNIQEAVSWCSYTYLWIRMQKNPMAYGLLYKELENDPLLATTFGRIVARNIAELEQLDMVSYDGSTVRTKDFGRIASIYYVGHETIRLYKERLQSDMSIELILSMISHSKDFERVVVREDDASVMQHILGKNHGFEGLEPQEDANRVLRKQKHLKTYCPIKLVDSIYSTPGKVGILIQAYISRWKRAIEEGAMHQRPNSMGSTLYDLLYVSDNVGRLFRAAFEMAMSKRHADTSLRVLKFCQSISKQRWFDSHPLCQFECLSENLWNVFKGGQTPIDILNLKNGPKNGMSSLDRVFDNRDRQKLLQCIERLPLLRIRYKCIPINHNTCRLDLEGVPDYVPSGRELFWIWIVDPRNAGRIWFCEHVWVEQNKTLPTLTFLITFWEDRPSFLLVHAINDNWIGCGIIQPIDLEPVVWPVENPTTYTNLTRSMPLSLEFIDCAPLERYYQTKGIRGLNGIQSTVFDRIYGQGNTLLCAPHGAGKSIMIDLAIWKSLRDRPPEKIVYMTWSRELAKKKFEEWRTIFQSVLGLGVLELDGHKAENVYENNILVGCSESWNRMFELGLIDRLAQHIGLVIIDQIQTIESDELLEDLVAKLKPQCGSRTRWIGISTLLNNPKDVARWLDVPAKGEFNFGDICRPTPLKLQVCGISGWRHGDQTMVLNKMIFLDLVQIPAQPSIVFVADKQEILSTVQSLVSLAQVHDNVNIKNRHIELYGHDKIFLGMREDETQRKTSEVNNCLLQVGLAHGIGVYHGDLCSNDQAMVEQMFQDGKIFVLVSTEPFAWRIDPIARLVIVRATERQSDWNFSERYNLMRMLSRAGRSGIDDFGTGIVYVKGNREDYFRSLLHDQFPLESSLYCKTDPCAKGTFLQQRMVRNPGYYQVMMENSSECVD